MKKPIEINIGGRDIPLYYSAYEMTAIQEEIGCTAYQLRDEVFGIRLADEDDPKSVVFDVATDAKKTKKLGTLIRILGNAGLEERGEAPDLTDKWVLRNIKSGMVLVYAVVLFNVIMEGNRMEAGEKEESGPVDVLVEEANAKKQPGS